MNFGLVARSKERMFVDPIPIKKSIIILITVNARAS